MIPIEILLAMSFALLSMAIYMMYRYFNDIIDDMYCELNDKDDELKCRLNNQNSINIATIKRLDELEQKDNNVRATNTTRKTNSSKNDQTHGSIKEESRSC